MICKRVVVNLNRGLGNGHGTLIVIASTARPLSLSLFQNIKKENLASIMHGIPLGIYYFPSLFPPEQLRLHVRNNGVQDFGAGGDADLDLKNKANT